MLSNSFGRVKSNIVEKRLPRVEGSILDYRYVPKKKVSSRFSGKTTFTPQSRTFGGKVGKDVLWLDFLPLHSGVKLRKTSMFWLRG